MSENPKEGLDRRDFMIASIATVGASAVLTRNAGPAKAQETAASTGDAASSAPQGTVYTGDLIQGKKVVSRLDVNDLEAPLAARFRWGAAGQEHHPSSASLSPKARR